MSYNNQINRFISVRGLTIGLAEQLSPEDTVVQPISDVSPPKWHLAHTTWFFENFILKAYIPDYKPYHPDFDYLFNSYYQSQGNRVQRDMRGFHPRPLFDEVLKYRTYINAEVLKLMETMGSDNQFKDLIELGIQHEQQHQELLLTDLKYIWGLSPLKPIYKLPNEKVSSTTSELEWLPIHGGTYEIGASENQFCFDNETPLHKVLINDFEIASRPVNVGEYLEFINAGGYETWNYWLYEGWQWLQNNGVEAPLYWKKEQGEWWLFTLNGFRKLDLNETLTHISFYEADAFARWKGSRLPTEQEWEVAALKYGNNDSSFNFLDHNCFHPTAVENKNRAFLGQVWEWTNSAYLPYPRFKPWAGGIGEYNGKFMVNQMVLRGGSCATPQNHIRPSYRNFFHPHLRWQFTGIRLAKDL